MIKPFTSFLLAILGFVFVCNSQEINYSGPVSAALANIKSLDNSSWAVNNNAALLGRYTGFTVGAGYQLRFNLSELSSRALLLIYPNKYGVFSASVSQSGFSKSQLNKYSFVYSRRFGQGTSAFFRYSYIHHQLINTDNFNGYHSALGLHQILHPNWQLGLLIINPEQAHIDYRGSNFQLPSIFSIGIVWKDGRYVKCYAEVEKQINYEAVYKGALELFVHKQISLRTGVKGQELEYSLGLGYTIKGLSLDVGFLYHRQLGISSGIGLIYSFKNSNK